MANSWQFEERNSQWDGWNNPQIANFKGERLKNLVREIIQNSLDNPDPESGNPVEVHFSLKDVERKDIPGISTICAILKDLKKSSVDIESHSAIQDIAEAYEASRKDRIPVLVIEDYETTGLAGPCELGRPFFNYLKAVGSSGADQSRTGSHGLGKAAPIANSSLRTIFVATRYPDEKGKEAFLFQGRVTLMSRKEREKTLSGVGFYGGNKFQPSTTLQKNYSWLAEKRKAIGTTIFVVGFEHSTHWKNKLIGYAISNYFAAFERNRLKVCVGQTVIDKKNMDGFFKCPEVHKAMADDNNIDELECAKYYLKCIRDGDDVTSKAVQITPSPGKGVISVLVEQGAPKKAAYIRNDMLITDQVPYFYSRVPGTLNEFAAVFECQNEEGLRILREMEPPQHNSLSEDWLESMRRKKGKRAIKALGERLKEVVKEVAQIELEDGGEATVLRDFLRDEAGEDGSGEIAPDIDPQGKFTFQPKPLSQAIPPPLGIFEGGQQEGGDGEDEGETGGSGQSGGDGHHEGEDGDGDGEGEQGTGTRGGRNVADGEIRARLIRETDKKAKIIVSANRKGYYLLKIEEVGLDSTFTLNITSASSGEVSDGGVRVYFPSKNQKLSFSVGFDRPVHGGYKLKWG